MLGQQTALWRRAGWLREGRGGERRESGELEAQPGNMKKTMLYDSQRNLCVCVCVCVRLFNSPSSDHPECASRMQYTTNDHIAEVRMGTSEGGHQKEVNNQTHTVQNTCIL